MENQEKRPQGERSLTLPLRDVVVLHAVVGDAMKARLVHDENWRSTARLLAKMEQFITQ